MQGECLGKYFCNPKLYTAAGFRPTIIDRFMDKHVIGLRNIVIGNLLGGEGNIMPGEPFEYIAMTS